MEQALILDFCVSLGYYEKYSKGRVYEKNGEKVVHGGRAKRKSVLVNKTCS
jgi:hypothetical protein